MKIKNNKFMIYSSDGLKLVKESAIKEFEIQHYITNSYYGFRVYWVIRVLGDECALLTEGPIGFDHYSLKFYSSKFWENRSAGSDPGQFIFQNDTIQESCLKLSACINLKTKGYMTISTQSTEFDKLNLVITGRPKSFSVFCDHAIYPMVKTALPEKWKCHENSTIVRRISPWNFDEWINGLK